MYHRVVLEDHAVAYYYAVVGAGGHTADQRSRRGIVSHSGAEEPPADHVVEQYQKVALEARAVHKRRHQRTDRKERTTATSASGGKKPTRTDWTVRAQ